MFSLIYSDLIIIFLVMYKHRIITEQLKKLTENFPVVVISGARQVGKSTLLQHAFPTIDTVVFDPVTDVGAAKTEPDVFLDNHPAPLILDEIQYAPTLTAAIKRRVDKAGHNLGDECKQQGTPMAPKHFTPR